MGNKYFHPLFFIPKASIDFSGNALFDLKCAMHNFAALSNNECFELNSVHMYEGTKSQPNLMYVYIFAQGSRFCIIPERLYYLQEYYYL